MSINFMAKSPIAFGMNAQERLAVIRQAAREQNDGSVSAGTNRNLTQVTDELAFTYYEKGERVPRDCFPKATAEDDKNYHTEKAKRNIGHIIEWCKDQIKGAGAMIGIPESTILEVLDGKK